MKLRTFHFAIVTMLAISAGVAFIFYESGIRQYSVDSHVGRIEKEYQALEQEIIETISNEIIISNLITDSYTFEEFSKLAALPFGMVVYEGDSAVMWTNNMITPINANIIYNDAPLFISESNGNYVILEHDFPGDIKVIGFLPIRFEYGIRNKYLSDVKTGGIVIPDHLEVDARPTSVSLPVRSVNGNPVFYIAENISVQSHPEFSSWLYICITISAILVLIVLFSFSQALVKKINPVVFMLIFAAMLGLLYAGVVYLLHSNIFSHLELFNPQYYGSPGIADSMGDLLIKTVLLFYFGLFFSRHFYYRPPAGLLSWALYTVIAVVLLFFSVLVGKVFKSLILDSSISFDIHNFFSLNMFSLIGFLCIALSLLSYFLIVIRLLDMVKRDAASKRTFLIVLAAVIVAYYLAMLLRNTVFQYDAILFLAGFVLLRWFLLTKKVSIRSMGGMMLWLIYFSLFSAYVFQVSLHKKSVENKRLFAMKKSNEKDPITEYLFSEETGKIIGQLEIQTDNTRQKERLRPGLVNQLRQEFQNNYFKKYNTEFFVFENDTLSVTTGEEQSLSRYGFVNAIETDGETTAAKYLYFIRDNLGSYYYLAEIPVRQDSISKITLYMRMVPKKFTGESIYPELLIDDDLRTAESFESFDYAIYDGHSLTEREGVYSYPLMDIFYLPKDAEMADVHQNDYEHFIYKVTDTKKVVVSEEGKSFLEPVSLFSYLFFFYLLFLVVALLLDFLVKLARGKIVFREWINTSLQNKIQTSVISLIIFAFIMMGVATIYYIADQYNDSHKQRLLNKIEAVQTNIDFLMNESKKKGGDRVSSGVQIRRIANRVAELSEIHDMDINLYQPDGDLINSSQPDIFEKGLLSVKMNALAFFKMSCDKETWYIQTEKIGNLPFLSAYVPLLDETGETMFYLNLPYFATEQNLRAEISSFMVTLVNVYVLLLIVAGIIAFAVSRSITSPLAAIAGKFKGIKLGKNNEPITWQHDDEIGVLVGEYNKMLMELEKSADLLARSERESAWRDMAKQVAHEIKNPLTPMRLSIQHLQRAMQTNAANLRELTQKVTATLLEQIDNLSHIASEFSNFAVMPKAVNEQLCLNDILENVASLFKESEQAEISLDMPQENIEVFADKNQLLRVFNNLVKNALQAIPSDQEGKVEITLEQFDHRAVVKVKDNGIGIPDTQKEKVFVPNFTTKSSGMGIGLAMSKNIVESTGGYIWFESTENKGTTFFVEFPIPVN